MGGVGLPTAGQWVSFVMVSVAIIVLFWVDLYLALVTIVYDNRLCAFMIKQ